MAAVVYALAEKKAAIFDPAVFLSIGVVYRDGMTKVCRWICRSVGQRAAADA
jgi:hypothetical protein